MSITMLETVTPEAVGLSSARLGRVTDLMRRYVDEGKLAGLVGVIWRSGAVAYAEAVGQRDIEAGTPMTLDTIFRIASMTKPITSVAVMMLYEEGRFQLNDPISRYLPELGAMQVMVGGTPEAPLLEPTARPVTVHDLFTHTGGLAYGLLPQLSPIEAMYAAARMTAFDEPLAEKIVRLGRLPLASQPGTRWQYSLSTDVLGRLVEVLSGQTLDVFFRERIFAPLGMTETGFQVAPSALDRLAALYTLGPTGLTLVEAPGASQFARPAVLLSGGGGLVSTPADYLRFCQMLLNEGDLDGVRLLGRKTVELMTMNHLPAALMPPVIFPAAAQFTAGQGFGLGVSVQVDMTQAQIIGSPGAYGWGGAFETVFWNDPAEDLIAMFYTQFAPSMFYPLRREVRVAVYQAIVE
ncbi:MAG: serine hydrolase domain-containing protein [Anaerolineae bacterium]